MRLICRVWVCGALLVVCGASAWGQGEPAAYKPPEDIVFRKATIISEGTRMAAELFSLKSPGGQEAADHHHVPRLGRRARAAAARRDRLCAGRLPRRDVRLPRLGCQRRPAHAG